MADECHGALDLPTESLDFTHGFSWTLQYLCGESGVKRRTDTEKILSLQHNKKRTAEQCGAFFVELK